MVAITGTSSVQLIAHTDYTTVVVGRNDPYVTSAFEPFNNCTAGDDVFDNSIQLAVQGSEYDLYVERNQCNGEFQSFKRI